MELINQTLKILTLSNQIYNLRILKQTLVLPYPSHIFKLHYIQYTTNLYMQASFSLKV